MTVENIIKPASFPVKNVQHPGISLLLEWRYCTILYMTANTEHTGKLPAASPAKHCASHCGAARGRGFAKELHHQEEKSYDS